MAWLFIFLAQSIKVQTFLMLMKFSFFFYFIYYAYGVIFENFLLNPGCHCNFLLCFLVEVSVSSLTVKYTHHFELIFMYGV